MRYRHIKTGVVIDVESEIRGDWEPLDAPAPREEAAQKKPAPTRKKAADGVRNGK